MWWFLKKISADTPAVDASISPRMRSEEQLLAQIPDLVAASHEVAIKIWLPALVAHALKSVTDYEGVSQSTWVRKRLFAYIYIARLKDSVASAVRRVRHWSLNEIAGPCNEPVQLAILKCAKQAVAEVNRKYSEHLGEKPIPVT